MTLYIKAPSFAFTNGGKKHLKQTMRQIGQELAKAVRVGLRSAIGAGRRYGKHTASSPGAIPTRLSGALAKSVVAIVGRSGSSVTIADKQYYSRFLETGARGGGGRQTSVTNVFNPKTGKMKQRRQRNRNS